MKRDDHKWDNKHPTAQMLGRWQPWHAGHQKLFEETLKKTGQVNIMVRDVKGVDDNPFDFETVKKNIFEALQDYKNRIQVTLVPNITNICYGRGVGYKIEEIVLDEKTQQISATKIREEMKELLLKRIIDRKNRVAATDEFVTKERDYTKDDGIMIGVW